MFALDPLLIIPRIEYVEDILAVIKIKNKGYTFVILDVKNFHLSMAEPLINSGASSIANFTFCPY